MFFPVKTPNNTGLKYLSLLLFLTGAEILQAQVTTINLNNSVLQSPVKRLGINLGGINYYDSGQMMKNLIVTNPGFEGLISQSMIQCSGGTPTSCTDSDLFDGWPADYWDGASYTVVYGTAVGRTGTITTSTANVSGSTGAVFNFAESGTAPSSGDYIVLKKTLLPVTSKVGGIPSASAVEGWSYTLGTNGAVSTNTTDLPSGTAGTQSLVLTAPSAGDSATITYYFDSTSGHTFLQLNGSYNLSFKAKTTNSSGSGSLYVLLKRFASQTPNAYVEATVPLTNQWQTFNFPFTASENGTAVGTAELVFSTSSPNNSLGANQVYLDDSSLVQQNTDPTNTTVFRDPVVNTLKQLNPGVIRFWFNQLGETLDNLLTPQLGRQRSNYEYVDINYISYGLGEFLQLCQTVGSGTSSPIEPWIVLPITLSNAEASNVIDYLAGPTSTIYGAKRAAAGQTAPWTTVFPKIHLEFSNEAWNSGQVNGSMPNPQAYGTRAQNVFSIMRANANYNAASFDLIINGQGTNIGDETVIQQYVNNNDTFASQPYMMLTVNDPAASGLTGAAAIENLFGSTFAEAEAFVTNSGTAENVNNGFILQNQGVAQSSGRPVQYAVTETNIDPFNFGSITQAELNGYTTSIGGGLALIDSMLQNMRVGVLTQNIFELPGYSYVSGSEKKSLYLYGTVVDMGVTNLQRPQFLAEALANSAISSNTTMLQTVHTGLDPTWNQPLVNSVQLNNAHYLQSFGFTNGGDNYSLVIINTNRSASEQVNFSGANIPGGTVQMTQLTSANITDTNESASVVTPVTSTLSSFNAAAGMTLPPFSMTVLTWTAPAISNVTVTNITGTSAKVSWTTDDATSTSVVNYGTTTAYGSQSATVPAGSTTQSVTLSGLTAGTTYNFAVTATNGAGATSSSGNFTFGTTASFTISVPASLSLAQGQSGSVPVLVTDTGGYTGSVTLSVGGLPTGATGSFQATSGGATLTLTLSSTVLGGTYPLSITGTAGGSTVTAPLSLIVSGASQTQTITFNPIPNQYIGAQVTAVATASSNLPVTFSVVQNGNCSVSGSTVTFLNAGNCGIIASQAGNSVYAPVAVGQIVVINSALPPQTITFGSIANQTVGAKLTLSATASSGLAVSFSSSTPSTCTVSGNTASVIGAGTCTIVASQAGNSSFAAAPNVPQSFNVVGQPQTITFPTIATQTAGTTITLAATASSTLSVSFASSTQSICTVSGTTATLITAGSCSITASQGGNSAYAAATPVSQTFTVNAAIQSQTITFNTIPAQNVGTPLALTASSSSGLAVSYVSNSSAVCTISGSMASFIAPGTCSITASQAGNNTTYSAATPVTQSFTVYAALKTQTITFGTIAAQYVGTPLTLTATASSNLPVSYVSNNTTVCTVSGSTASFNAQGTCSITALQAGNGPGNGAYAAAAPVTQSFTVNPTAYTQTITFNAIATQTVGTSLTLSATASSQQAVSFASTTPSVCAVSGTTASFVAAGMCSITASQPGNNLYQAATPVTQSFTVNPGPQTITFGAIAAQTVGTPLTLTANASSGLAVSFSSTTTSICTVSGATATLIAPGTCSITASQAGNSSYTAATPVTQSFAVLQSQTITFGTIAAQQVGTPLTLNASASSGLAVSYTSSTTSICTVSGSAATFVTPGTCTITASQAGTSTYSAAAPVTQSFTVNAAPSAQTITFGTINTQQVGTPLTLNASASSGLQVSYASNTASVCTVSGTTATFITSGTCSITASQAGNSAYKAATPVTQTFTVNGEGQIITFNPIAAQTVGTSLTLSATASSGLPVSYSSATGSICSVSGTTASFAASGTCTITASQAGNSIYAAATSVTQSVAVQGGSTTTGAATTVTLGSAANLSGISANGSAVANGGLDTYSYAYSATLLGTGLTFQGMPYSLGTAATGNAASSTTITLPAGSYSALNFLGTAVNGAQASQTFTVTYSDGSTSTFTQSMSDWGYPQSYTGETIASTMAYRLAPNGSQATGQNWYLYAYSFALNSAKTVQSFTLPNNRNVTVLAVTLSAASASATAQTITFGTITTQTVGTPLTLSATASSGLAVSYASSTTSICTVSGGIATFLAAGTCTVTASQAGNATYAAATPVSQSFTVQGTTTTISLASVANVYGIFSNGNSVANGGLDGYSYAYSANLLGTSLSFQGIPYSFGTAGTANATTSTTIALPAGSYSALHFLGTAVDGTQASQTFTVTYTDGSTSAFTQSMSDWGGYPLNYAGETAAASMAYRLAPNGSQTTGQTWYLYAYSFALNSAKTVQSFTLPSNRNVTVLAVTLSSASASGTAQTITFGTIAAQTVGTPLTLNATASSGLTVSYASSTASVCTVSGSTVTFLASGTCTITASQAGNTTYTAATPVSQSFTVNGQAQTITFGTIATQTVGTPLTLSATATSGLAVSYASSTTSICTVSGSTVTFLAGGTCAITASQAGNSSYAAATPVSQSFTVNAATLKSQTITFGTIATQTVGTPLTLGATSSSGLAVSYASSTTSICTVSGGTVTFVSAGTCAITASQAGNATYAAATPVSQSFTVNAAAQTITFGTIAAQTVGTPLTLSATASSGLAVTYTSSTTSVCTVSGNAATFLASGTCTITASQAGNGSYAAATPVSQSFTVNASALKGQTITFGTIAAQTVGTPLTLSASASSGLGVSYASSTTSICTVSGSTATFLAGGTCTITASQAGNSSYTAATPVTQSFSVNAASQTITFNAIPAQAVGGTVTVSASASSGLPVTFTLVPNGNCSISGSVVTLLNVGNCGVIANQGGNSSYAAAPAVGQIIVVKGAQTITFNAIPAQTVGSKVTVSATASSGLAVSFTLVPNGNCSISGNVVTMLNSGNCGVIASQAGNNNYAAAPAVGQIIVVH
jgi:hypothetical protein